MTALILALVFTPAAAPDVKVERDVVYANIDGLKLRMDIARPTTPGPHPAVVGFHGGAWKYGNKADLSRSTIGFFDFGGTGGRSLIETVAKDGYVAVSVQYRLAPDHKWPAQIEDAKTAIRFLRENAKAYDIDPEHMGAFGFSAGGHIAALLGTTDSDDGLDGKLYPNQSSEVQCVVDYFGPTDMTLYAESPGLEKGYMVPLFGKKMAAAPDIYKQASPLYHVKKTNAPILICHGTADLIVPIIHSERFLDKLEAAKVPCRMISVKGKGHGWTGDPAVECRKESMKFMDQYLKVKK